MTTDFTPTPARGYSWEQFKDGNEVAVRHGAYSERAIAERALEVHGRLLEVAPWLAEDVFMPAVTRYLRAESRALLLHEHIEKLCAEKGAGAVASRVWEQVTACDRLAAQLGHDLGLSPRGRAEVRKATADAEVAGATVADLAEQGKLIRQRRAALLAQDGSGVSDVPPTDLNATAANVSTPGADSEGSS